MQKEPELEFPLDWHYKIIVNDKPEMDVKLSDIFKKFGYEVPLTQGNKSKKGTFQTYRASVTFNDKKSMDTLSQALANCPDVKFLL